MRKSSLVSLFVHLIALSFTPHVLAEDVGPARFFDMQTVRDESTLDTTIHKDQVRDSIVRPGKQVRIIELGFTSQHWKGLEWKHPARIYVPQDYLGDGNAGIIGTERQFFDEPHWPRHKIPNTGQDTEAQYAEATAIDLNMPIMLFANPPQDYWGLSESDMTGYALKKMLETGDLTWNGYHPIAMSYLRAITVMHSLPSVRTQRAVLLGCSKRGQAVSVTTGIDPDRVAGVMATCHFGGNTLNFLAKKFAEFGPSVGGPDTPRAGPGFQPAEQLLRNLNNPVGLQMLVHYDPYMWRDSIRSSFLVAVGTNDEFFALGTPNSMLREMKGDKAFLAIDNLRHSWVSSKHLAAWRMWLAHTFRGREVPRVNATARVQGRELSVQATVEAASPPVGVKLYYAYNPHLADWRQAKWSSVEMFSSDGTASRYAAQLPLREGQRLAYYVEVEDIGKGGPGYISSLIETAD